MSAFPFVVLCEGVCFDGYIWWHYLVYYAVFTAFYLLGRLCGAWAINPRHSRSFKPKAIFLSRLAAALPIIVFFIVCAGLDLTAGLYLYILPAAIILFFGGHSTVGREYTDIFTRGWFAMYFVVAVISSLILWFTHEDEIISPGGYQLCFGFGVLIILAAVLANQTNIDTCTQQRDFGKTVLPQGLRRYNAWLVAAVVAAIVALFLFTKPLAQLFFLGIKQIILGLLWLFTRGETKNPENNLLNESGDGVLNVGVSDNSFAEATTVLLVIGIIAILVIFRRQIAELLSVLFSPMFRMQEQSGEPAYSDEISEAVNASKSSFSRRRSEQQLYKQFRREEDAVKKYRIGYKLMMMRLEDTPFATVPTDNTDIHRIKGENGLRSDKVQQIVEIYNDVRYKGRVPAAEELSFEENFIEEIRR